MLFTLHYSINQYHQLSFESLSIKYANIKKKNYAYKNFHLFKD